VIIHGGAYRPSDRSAPLAPLKPITPKLVGAKPIKANALDEEKV
jgi:hypothetical protein